MYLLLFWVKFELTYQFRTRSSVITIHITAHIHRTVPDVDALDEVGGHGHGLTPELKVTDAALEFTDG